jgi:Biotin-lipoyl like
MQAARSSVGGPSLRHGLDEQSNGGVGPAAEQAALGLLLRIELLARKAVSLSELRLLAANETRKLNRARQIFVVEVDGRQRPRVVAVSGVASVDGSSVLLTCVGDLVGRLAKERGLKQSVDFTLPAFTDPDGDLATSYPFRNVLWVPLAARDGAVFAGLVCSRETVWGQSDIAVSNRLGETYAHAWREFAGSRRSGLRALRPRVVSLTLGVLALGAMLLPVPMTALAPAEIVASEPMIVSALVDGVVETIDVDPGQDVRQGDVLVRLSDTVLRNKTEIARREVAVAEARIKQTSILAMSDARGRHELGIAEADLQLKRAELAFAVDMLGRTVIKAGRAGVAAYPDRKSLIGRPVATGERIMEIADPAAVEIRIDVAMPDAIALTAAGRVKLFLDIEPLSPREARIVRSDYKARPGDSDILAFKTFARLEGGEKVPRIGLRGTAQIYGEPTYLGVFLFRRPLASARQYLGL